MKRGYGEEVKFKGNPARFTLYYGGGDDGHLKMLASDILAKASVKHKYPGKCITNAYHGLSEGNLTRKHDFESQTISINGDSIYSRGKKKKKSKSPVKANAFNEFTRSLGYKPFEPQTFNIIDLLAQVPTVHRAYSHIMLFQRGITTGLQHYFN